MPHFDFHKKYHDVKFEVPPVKFLGITIRKGYIEHQIVYCECGESMRDRFIKGWRDENTLLKKILER